MKQFCLAIALGLAALPAAAATLEDLTTARVERDAVWEEVPFGARVAVFAEASAAGFGDYTQRASNVFKQTDPFFLYVEPVGYGFSELEDGRTQQGVSTDIRLKDADGNVLVDKKNALAVSGTYNRRVHSLYLVITNGPLALPVGTYSFELVLHDVTGDATAIVPLPFEIVE